MFFLSRSRVSDSQVYHSLTLNDSHGDAMKVSIPDFNWISLKVRRNLIRAQNVVRLAGIDIQRYRLQPPKSNVLALTISDVILQKVLAGGSPSDFLFLQIGANDGLTDDPIRHYVLKYGFRGVLVEPQPVAFEALKRNYAGRSRLVFENAAIARSDGKVTLYRFRAGTVPRWADCLSSFSREVLVANFDRVRGEVEEIEVPAISFPTLLAKHRLSTVDLLQIDTEGFDFEVIKMIDFAVFRPRIINFEAGLLLWRVRQDAYEYLRQRGYKVTENEFDAVAYLEPEDQALTKIRIRPD